MPVIVECDNIGSCLSKMSMSEAAMKRNSNYHTIWEKQLSIFFKYDVSKIFIKLYNQKTAGLTTTTSRPKLGIKKYRTGGLPDHISQTNIGLF